MNVSAPVLTWRALPLHSFVKHFYTAFYEYLTNGLAADITSETDEWRGARKKKRKWSQHKQFFISHTRPKFFELLYWRSLLNCVRDKAERPPEHVFEFRSRWQRNTSRRMVSKQNIGYQKLLQVYMPLQSISPSVHPVKRGSTLHFHITIYNVVIDHNHADICTPEPKSVHADCHMIMWGC